MQLSQSYGADCEFTVQGFDPRSKHHAGVEDSPGLTCRRHHPSPAKRVAKIVVELVAILHPSAVLWAGKQIGNIGPLSPCARCGRHESCCRSPSDRNGYFLACLYPANKVRCILA